MEVKQNVLIYDSCSFEEEISKENEVTIRIIDPPSLGQNGVETILSITKDDLKKWLKEMEKDETSDSEQISESSSPEIVTRPIEKTERELFSVNSYENLNVLGFFRWNFNLGQYEKYFLFWFDFGLVNGILYKTRFVLAKTFELTLNQVRPLGFDEKKHSFEWSVIPFHIQGWGDHLFGKKED